MEKKRRPKVLLFVADQLRADHLGCYGNSTVRTPNIDNLAARGCRAANFHAASVICMPNRATLLTGRMPSLHGVRRNGIPLPYNETTFVELLRRHGYQTALVGKAHFQPFGQFLASAAGTEAAVDARQLPGDETDYRNEWIAHWKAAPGHRVQLPYYGFDHAQLCLYHGDLVEGDYAMWLAEQAPEWLNRRGREHSLPDERYLCRDAWRTGLPAELYPTSYIAGQTQQWLEKHARVAPNDPFFVMCSFPDPHHPFTPPGKYWDMYAPADVHLPDSFHESVHNVHVGFIHQLAQSGVKAPNNHVPFAPSEREAREAIALTYGSITHIDDAIGRVLETLRSTGLAESTVVAFTSDHGDLMGDHGVFLKGPMHFRGLSRVPFIWVDPFAKTTGRCVESACGTIDLARTVLDVAGCPAAVGMQGQSLLPALQHDQPLEDAGRLIENESAQLLFGRSAPFHLRSLVTRDWRITYSEDPDLCEMYDFKSDPLECKNLWSDPAHRPERETRLMALMDALMKHSDAGMTAHSGG